ncbi:hypothetical protein DXN04_14280 [Chitinophaga silvisoli]|uniref:Uncharacterized protein n=1 Tax=Chitinophaga silvisoli TaxID=2291814 RepID=A0A3E1P3J3_9BACT|nr:hypothetical protein DXN04_14280 [Chitinophaga silvisoli]
MGSFWIDFDCPNCSYSVEVQLIDVKLQSSVICHNCKTIIHIIDDSASTNRSINDINTAFDNLFNKFK